MNMLPDEMRKNQLSKKAAPHGKKDRFDYTGESPYTMSEVVAGRLWQVAYDQEEGLWVSAKGHKEAMGFMGLQPMTESFEERLIAGARVQGEEFVDVAKKDLLTIRYWAAKHERGDTELSTEDIASMPYFVLNMFVVKLASGGVLLYAPVTVRAEVPQFAKWLDDLGPVEWIVVASGSHTLHIRAIAERYPHAKIIGPATAEAKVKLVMDLRGGRFDYLTTDAAELGTVNEILATENIKVINIDGDVNNAVVVRVDKTLLECDLIYGHGDGIGMFGTDEQRLRQYDPKDWTGRMFKFCMLNKPNSPHGMLPNYRYWLMDPNAMGFFMYDSPPSDGSYCGRMADSLRKLLSLDFDRAVGVHGVDMTGETFASTIDKSWNWLDGSDLNE